MLSDRRDPETSSVRTLLLRALVLTGTMALGTVVAWLVGVGAPAHATERMGDTLGDSDVAQLDPGQLDPGQLDPSQLDPSQLDPSQLDPSQLDPGQLTSGRLLAAPPDDSAEHAEDRGRPTPPDSVVGGQNIAMKHMDTAPQHETPKSAMSDHTEAQPVWQPLGNAVHELPSFDDLVSANDLPAIRGLPAVHDLPAVRDIARLVQPLWTDQASNPPISPNSSDPGNAVAASPAVFDVDTTTPSWRDVPTPRSRDDVVTGPTASTTHEASKNLDVRVVSRPESVRDESARMGVAAPVITGFVQGALPLGWYPTPLPSEAGVPSAPSPNEDHIRTGTSAPQPGTTPD